jgi:4'-phosphopantetheinyl transferase
MIYWLLQSTFDHPDLACGIAPAGLLSDSEQARLATFKVDKRRRDWLLGRWTAKRLVQSYVEQQTGLRLSLDALIISTDPEGAPHIQTGDWRLETGDRERNLQSAICNLQLSISHSGGRAICALARERQIGVDIERIEARDWQFVEDYFTADEIHQVWLAPTEQYETIITAIWSAKEAALKAFHLGLSVDTHSVSCSIATPRQACDWAEVRYTCDHRLLHFSTAPALTGWWRTIDGYVLTVATAEAGEAHPHLVSLSPFHSVREA